MISKFKKLISPSFYKIHYKAFRRLFDNDLRFNESFMNKKGGLNNQDMTSIEFLYLKYFRICETNFDNIWGTYARFRLNQIYKKTGINIGAGMPIGPGMIIGHWGTIVVNGGTTFGSEVMLTHNVTIGRDIRGKRKGAPKIGSRVCIRTNSTVTGNIKIGNDVLIAPNTFVNFDVPDHSVVIGNPAKIHHKFPATEGHLGRSNLDMYFNNSGNIQLFTKKDDCCGCALCQAICLQEAIVMVEDKEGFRYPAIDIEKCINCEACIHMCAFKDPAYNKNEFERPVCYGVKHKSNEVVENSRSGGIFTALSDKILADDGVIYGCTFDENYQAIHMRATTKDDRNKFRGSKYIQSRIDGIFSLVKEDLINGKKVLFSGTSCQVAALKKYLRGINTDALLLVDIVCHGVPSPLVWSDYLNYMRKKYKGEITSVDFRNKKDFGWSEHVESIWINGKQHNSRIFTTLFYAHNILRPSCYACPYKNTIHPGDITIADFWGFQKSIPTFKDDKGVSLVLINNQKGSDNFNMVQEMVIAYNVEIENAMQPPLKESFERPKNRDDFWKEYLEHYDLDYIIKKYCCKIIKEKNKQWIKNEIKRKIRSILKH